MTYSIIRGNNGRRHEVEFGDLPVRVAVHASEETVEIFVEADFETHAEERRPFAILNVPVTYSAELPADLKARGCKNKSRPGLVGMLNGTAMSWNVR